MGKPVDLTCGHHVNWDKAMYAAYKATKVLTCPQCGRRAIPANDVARAAREATQQEIMDPAQAARYYRPRA